MWSLMLAATLRRCAATTVVLIGLSLGISAVAHAQTGSTPDESFGAGVIVGPPPPIPPAMFARDAEGRLTMRAVRIEKPLVIDGRLDEKIYERIPGVNGFIQQEPHGGQPATEETDAWVFYDDQNIYFAGRMCDSHPERIVANELRRDNFNIGQNDSFSVALDTFYDRRSGYYF
jgi:hypothetical protein